MTFGAYIRRLRLANSMGLRELARAVSVQMGGRGVTHAYRSGPIRLNSSPRFLSGFSADSHAASLPVGSITA